MSFDKAKITVKAGKGGDGAVSFRREKYVPFGGPDGGDGGDGGNVYLNVDEGMNNLRKFERKSYFVAGNGGRGSGKKKHGKRGEDIFIGVPAGTEVWDSEHGELMADLIRPGEKVTVACGGKGGLGNARFASSTNQAPEYAKKGEEGEEGWIRLELKLIADVGIIGLPNVGKSTLLAKLSMAKPEIGDYLFTTLIPNLGVVEVEGENILLADIPGIIEGSYLGKGLGLEFLRHIERTRVLVHVIDGTSPDPIRDYEAVSHELYMYDPHLAQKPQVVAVNKIDIPEVRKHSEKYRHFFQDRGVNLIHISALTGEEAEFLLQKVMDELRQVPKTLTKREPFKVFRPVPLER